MSWLTVSPGSCRGTGVLRTDRLYPEPAAPEARGVVVDELASAGSIGSMWSRSGVEGRRGAATSSVLPMQRTRHAVAHPVQPETIHSSSRITTALPAANPA